MPTCPPVVPLPQRDSWTRALTDIAAQPLELCPDLPRIAQRLEAWWNASVLDRPVLLASANTNPARPVTRRLNLLDSPAEWLAEKKKDMLQQQRFGEALPTVRVDFGPVLLGALLGGHTEFNSDTTWTHAFIQDDWSNAPDWSIHEDHPWWPRLLQLLDLVSEDARGRYILCTPDLGGSADVLLNLRGSSELCMDALEQPQVITHAINAIYPAWRRAFIELYQRPTQRGTGVVHWLGLWSNQPYMIPACDFNYMIGPDEFNRICLPDIARQAATAGRAIFHLDGPGAARHIDALLDIPDIQAIQYVPGAGEPSTLAWLDLFRKIQARGKALLAMVPQHEVLEFSRALKPEGLAISVEGADPATLPALFEEFQRLHR